MYEVVTSRVWVLLSAATCHVTGHMSAGMFLLNDSMSEEGGWGGSMWFGIHIGIMLFRILTSPVIYDGRHLAQS